ncbi:prolyl oligopeptidase family serine peptidase [Paraglaciecola aestuariivivens]
MKRILLLGILASSMMACTPPQNTTKTTETEQKSKLISYPDTRKDDVVDTYFSTEVPDPYRWLEDDMSEETAAWVKAQNKVTFDYLSQLSSRDTLEKRLTQLVDYEKFGMPFVEGQYTYFYKNDGLQNQYVLYRQKGDAEPEVFLDPNTFSEDGTVSLGGVFFTEDGSQATYLLSEGGSDWRTAVTIDTETKQEITTRLNDIKFSGIAWRGNQGFYYSSYDKPEGSELSAKTDQHKVYFHKLGTEQASDQLIFGGTEAQKHRYVGADVTEDGQYLLISASNTTSGNKLYLQDLNATDSQLVAIDEQGNADTYLLDSEADKLYLVTNLNAPNKRVVVANANKPQAENWQDLIAETEQVLSPSTAGKFIFAKYMQDAISVVKQFDYKGQLVREVTLPGVGTAGGFSAKEQAKSLYFSFQNYKTSYSIYTLDIKTGEFQLDKQAEIDFNSDQYVSEQVFYSSKDGTKVPMIITHKKDLKLDGTNPTILYAYGGFNISLTPSFNPYIAAWLEQGGVYAVANLRGGGEYGKTWHKAGTQLQKQNVFDDFIAAAEFLIDEKYSSPKRLAIRGGSNGGLLVGAVMLQRPELFAVALPAVGVLDMLRYHTFTSGAGWAYDYGTSADSKEMFEYLLGYSPLHNVKSGVDYPATLITTGDHDDRVVPAHSFKFAAELQSKHTGSNPILIRIETDAGHGAGTPTSKVIEQYADIFAFTLHNMGLEAK